jgi:hypothetical protein
MEEDEEGRGGRGGEGRGEILEGEEQGGEPRGFFFTYWRRLKTRAAACGRPLVVRLCVKKSVQESL